MNQPTGILKNNYLNKLTSYQLKEFREFRLECNIKYLEYQIQRYSDVKHPKYNYFKNKTNNWSYPYWGNVENEIILTLYQTNGLTTIEILECNLLGLSRDITDYSMV